MPSIKRTLSDIYVKITYVWFPDGTVRRMVADDGVYFCSCIHPHGDQAAFYGGAEGLPRIWHYDFASGVTRPLSSPEVGSYYPSYSWDGTRIVFASDGGVDQPRDDVYDLAEVWAGGFKRLHRGVINVFVMDSDGSNVHQITRGPYIDYRPCFSPDGRIIVFLSNRSGTERAKMWAVPADGSEDPVPIEHESWAGRPWFSVDGKWIFFFSDVEGRHAICRVPSSGGARERLPADDRGMSHGPFADPDGEHLWMHSTRDGTWGIWKLPLHGGDPVRLDPPGFRVATHATCARNGCVTFDSSERRE